jgi:metal-responsive CopG/Arc/MetJ family transcriptional regulator
MARKYKYMERMIVSSVNIPDSIFQKLEKMSAEKNISRSNLIIAYIIKGMDEYDVADILAELDSKINKEKEEQEKELNVIKNIIYKVISENITDIKTSIEKNVEIKTVIIAFQNRLTPAIRKELLEQNIDADIHTKNIKQIIEMYILKIKGE